TNPNAITANSASVLTLTVNIPSNLTGTVTNQAAVSNPNECPACGGNNGSGPTPPTPVARVADVAVVKNGPANATAGSSVSYSAVVTNNGPSAANGTTLTDVVDARITGVVWTCGGAGGGAVCGAAASGTGNSVNAVIQT